MQNLQTSTDFQVKHPTLVQQRRALHNGTKPNPFTKVAERLAEVSVVESHIGGIIHSAGMTFLESIHQEIENAKEPWQKSYEADLEEEAQQRDERNKTATLLMAE